MNILKNITFITLGFITLASCKHNLKTNEKAHETIEKTAQSDDSPVLMGDYVSEGYTKRNEGYDWVAVSVEQKSDSTIHISVRSRADKKKPTCTFDTDAIRINDSLFKSTIDGKSILFAFKNNTINIATENNDDNTILNYYCSGGGSLANTYKKTNDPLDEKQIDPRVFYKTLTFQNIGFDISSTGRGSLQQLTIQPYGLKTDNKKIRMVVDGTVTNAEISDLDSDGFPEILIYTTSAGSGSYGNVIGYSVNNGKSLSQIYFPTISDNPKANKGYMGHDEFSIAEKKLIQRFKTYNEEDPNSNPTGNIRTIHYKLEKGEASKKFVADKIIESSAK
ncbi:hypothetical protein FLJC2902T_13770 [Flavobacterium limnosediminis JC2902]|uniref:PliI/PliC-like inhibitor of I-type lysozyme n=1 Tax=Flavobacterium limnosediminis JC2902 TaxID=1341181 RepID=V6SWJ7_9FLAO|nr:PliI family lysozyme inhibitor of I-type lysozyme [Flavobacterium limnosediminis]ESU28780.1 hypothetical protein FLJC2902T_13770 [Flavobacterium limnosediminis JC2902]